MPKTLNGKNHRKCVRIPVAMINEIDRIVKEHIELCYNRQKFIECAIREKIEKIQQIETHEKTSKSS